jgi:ribonuclease D
LVKELLGREMDKNDQTSDWAKGGLTESQLEYAANDVRCLIPIYLQLKSMLEREGRLELAEKAFKCLPVICDLDIAGPWSNIFEH